MAPGIDHVADRAERRGQDHAVQRAHRPAAAVERAGCASTAATSPTCATPSGPARPGPHVPAPRGVRGHDGVREPPGRGGGGLARAARSAGLVRLRHRDEPAHRRGRSRRCSTWSASGTCATGWRARSAPGRCASSSWAGRSAPTRRCCSSTSRAAASTRRDRGVPGRAPRRWPRRGVGDPAGRARRRARDGAVGADLRARLRRR